MHIDYVAFLENGLVDFRIRLRELLSHLNFSEGPVNRVIVDGVSRSPHNAPLDDSAHAIQLQKYVRVKVLAEKRVRDFPVLFQNRHYVGIVGQCLDRAGPANVPGRAPLRHRCIEGSLPETRNGRVLLTQARGLATLFGAGGSLLLLFRVDGLLAGFLLFLDREDLLLRRIRLGLFDLARVGLFLLRGGQLLALGRSELDVLQIFDFRQIDQRHLNSRAVIHGELWASSEEQKQHRKHDVRSGGQRYHAFQMRIESATEQVLEGTSNTLHVIDVTDVSSAYQVGVINDNDALADASRIHVAGNYAYITANGSDKLTVVDITDPANPAVVVSATGTSMNGPYGLFVAGKHAYVSSDSTTPSLSIFSLTGLDVPTADIGNLDVGSLSVTDNALIRNDLSTSNQNIAYHLDVGGNISVGSRLTQKPTEFNPPFLDGLVTDSSDLNGANDVFVSGQFAYVTAGATNKLTVIDVTIPTGPVQVGVFENNIINGAGGVYVLGRFAYVTGTEADNLAVVDVSDPTDPTLAGSVGSDTRLDGAFGIYVVGQFAYVTASADNRLTIVDISDPANPFIVGSLTNASLVTPTHVYVVNDLAYVTSEGANTLTVIDVFDHFNPHLAH